jgi:hypothetical protein
MVSNELFAKCDVYDNPTGHTAIVKKMNGQWKEIYTGQQPPSDALRNQYDIPADF